MSRLSRSAHVHETIDQLNQRAFAFQERVKDLRARALNAPLALFSVKHITQLQRLYDNDPLTGPFTDDLDEIEKVLKQAGF